MTKEILIQLCRDYAHAKKVFNEQYLNSDPMKMLSLQRTKDFRATQIAEFIEAEIENIEIKVSRHDID